MKTVYYELLRLKFTKLWLGLQSIKKGNNFYWMHACNLANASNKIFKFELEIVMFNS